MDETLDVLAAHGIAGMTGILFIGFFAQESWNGVADGLLYGNADQLGDQALAASRRPAYAFAMTFVILRVIGLVMPLRATEREEALGMDVVQHGEEAYATGEGAILVTPEAVAQTDGDRLERPRKAPVVLRVGLVALDLPAAGDREALVDGDARRVVAVLHRVSAADQHRPARAVGAGLLRVDLVLVARVVREEDALADVALAELQAERGTGQGDREDGQRERELAHAAKLPEPGGRGRAPSAPAGAPRCSVAGRAGRSSDRAVALLRIPSVRLAAVLLFILAAVVSGALLAAPRDDDPMPRRAPRRRRRARLSRRRAPRRRRYRPPPPSGHPHGRRECRGADA